MTSQHPLIVSSGSQAITDALMAESIFGALWSKLAFHDEFSRAVVSFVNGLVKRAATEQGGLLNGNDPTAFNSADPIRLWIVQLGIIVITSQLLSMVLRKMHQPKVISEVLGGIVLGPTAFGRIPGFKEHIFPDASIPYLSLVANIGLVLFLFLVGLEIDAGVVKRNARLSAMVSLAGMILPFGFGAALATPLYNQFIDPSVKFTHFLLFTGVAYSITAFPVLCRILTELKLLDTTVGIVVLSAGVGNDIIGWTLLALSVALVNAGSGLTALWILLTCVAWALFLLVPGKMFMLWLARRTGSIENGPTMFYMTFTFILVFGSAFLTDSIGVHAIFGAFLAGLIVPRQGGLTIQLAEKLEDMVTTLFLPLYFTLSGLSTDLGLLNDGITWAYTVAICSLAFIGKFGGCTLAAKYAAGFEWREATTIGSLMSCKGLVELIVLNVGLSAGILSRRVFSMFVLEALVLTFITTPLVTVLYPVKYRTRGAPTGPNFANVDDGAEARKERKPNQSVKSSFTIVLDKIDHVPAMMALTQLIQPMPSQPSPLHAVERSRAPRNTHSDENSLSPSVSGSIFVDALRLIELSDRASAVMKSSVWETLLITDPLLAIFRMFGQLNDMPMRMSLAVVPHDDWANTVAEHALENGSQMVMIPWLPPSVTQPSHTTAHNADVPSSPTPGTPSGAMTPTARHGHNNPFDHLFQANTEKTASVMHSQFVRSVFALSKNTDVALFVDQSGGKQVQTGRHHHIFFPFFGGPDDRCALEFVMQLCLREEVSASVVRVVKKEYDAEVDEREAGEEKTGKSVLDSNQNAMTVTSNNGFPDTVYGHATEAVMMQSETADNLLWKRYAEAAPTSPSASSSSTSLASTYNPRVKFTELASPAPLHSIIALGSEHATQKERTRTLIVTGRSRRMAVEDHQSELKEIIEEYGHVGGEARKTIGDVGTAFVAARCGCGIVVVQAAESSVTAEEDGP